jgi:DNA-binding Lrp family transcriptional regulator
MTRGYVLINTEVGQASAVVERLRQIPGVTLVDVVTGPYDIMAVLEGADTTALGKLVLQSAPWHPGAHQHHHPDCPQLKR